MLKYAMVTWVDSCNKGGWTDADDCASLTEINSFGILVHQDEEKVVLSTSHCKEHDNYLDPVSIPTQCILTLTIYSDQELQTQRPLPE